jgi:hypothetical protein
MERATYNDSGVAQVWPRLLAVVSEANTQDILQNAKDCAKSWQNQRGECSFSEVRGHSLPSPPWFPETSVTEEDARVPCWSMDGRSDQLMRSWLRKRLEHAV